MPKHSISTLLFLLSLTTTVTFADFLEHRDIPDPKRTKAGLYLTAKDTYALLQENASDILFIDVRTRSELAWQGIPNLLDANIPLMFLDPGYQWDDKRNNFKLIANPRFVKDVTKQLENRGLDKSAKVIVMCRSGKRSAKAADTLTDAGYTQVISVIDGFEGDKAASGEHKGHRVVNGWKNAKLPWSSKLVKNKMYLSAGDLAKPGQ